MAQMFEFADQLSACLARAEIMLATARGINVNGYLDGIEMMAAQNVEAITKLLDAFEHVAGPLPACWRVAPHVRAARH
jgi:hypothetical protein